jgi:hypothetical protein
MTTQEYKVRYKDGREQTLSAEKYGRYGDRYAFSRDGQEILNVAADAVESIAFADVPDPVGRRVPRSAAV